MNPRIEIDDDEEELESSDILVLDENPFGGHDYQIADLHGHDICLKTVLAQLTANDRLFIAGDLVDRGPDSLEVLRAVMAYQAQLPDRLYVIAGNHEDKCLKTIAALERLTIGLVQAFPDEDISLLIMLLKQKIENGDESTADLKRIKSHLKDGAVWLVNLFLQNVVAKAITFKCEIEDQVLKVVYTDTSPLKAILKFMHELPCIIFVDGTQPFYVVHADMPMSDDDFMRKIEFCNDLSSAERGYATQARVVKPGEKIAFGMKDTYRDVDSNIAYTGHNIIVYGGASVVRYATNTVNLDVNTCKTGVALRVNHTLGMAEYVGQDVNKSLIDFPALGAILVDLNQHLAAQKQLFNPVIQELQNEASQSPVKGKREREDEIQARSPFKSSPVKLSPLKTQGTNDSPSRENRKSGLFDTTNSPPKKKKVDSVLNDNHTSPSKAINKLVF